MEERQLVLLEGDSDREQWRLDEATRRAGRQGVEQARAALRQARRAAEDERSAA